MLIELFLISFGNKKTDLNLLFPFINERKMYVEDTFLSFYRFAELIKKKLDGNNWLDKLLERNKELICLLKIKYQKEISLVMTTLRNHYVHEGYYIRSNLLEIKGVKGKKKRISNELKNNYSRIIKAVSYKIILNELMHLNISDSNIVYLI